MERTATQAARSAVPAPATPAPTNGARAALDRREQSERAFLALCLALPDEGEARLTAADLDELFSAPATRRAAEYLRGRLRSCLARHQDCSFYRSSR